MSQHPDREQMDYLPGKRDGILPAGENTKNLFPSLIRHLDLKLGYRISELIHGFDVAFHGESGRERFNPKNVLLQTGTATGTAIGSYLAASLIQERLLDRSSAIVHAQELGLEQAVEEVQVAGVIAPTEPVESLTEENLLAAAPLNFEQRVAIERELRPIYEQFVDANGLMIKAPAEVDPRALEIAKQTVERMLNTRPDIKQRLLEKEATISIVPQNKSLVEIPELEYLTHQSTFDGRVWANTRGRGANNISVVTAIGEENLLKLPSDASRSQDILTHEFGHTIMNLGFNEEEFIGWKDIYRKAKTRPDTFAGAYALSNEREYWAVLTQLYFGVVTIYQGINNPAAIRQHDLDAYQFIQSVYGPPPPIAGK